jgi:hypothetical protein
MQWLHLLAKLSPERVQPILREGQCKPPADYKYVMVTLRYTTQRPLFGL